MKEYLLIFSILVITSIPTSLSASGLLEVCIQRGDCVSDNGARDSDSNEDIVKVKFGPGTQVIPVDTCVGYVVVEKIVTGKKVELRIIDAHIEVDNSWGQNNSCNIWVEAKLDFDTEQKSQGIEACLRWDEDNPSFYDGTEPFTGSLAVYADETKVDELQTDINNQDVCFDAIGVSTLKKFRLESRFNLPSERNILNVHGHAINYIGDPPPPPPQSGFTVCIPDGGSCISDDDPKDADPRDGVVKVEFGTSGSAFPMTTCAGYAVIEKVITEEEVGLKIVDAFVLVSDSIGYSSCDIQINGKLKFDTEVKSQEVETCLYWDEYAFQHDTRPVTVSLGAHVDGKEINKVTTDVDNQEVCSKVSGVPAFKEFSMKSRFSLPVKDSFASDRVRVHGHAISTLETPPPSECGSGDHWVDDCASGTDEMTTGATLKVSMGKDCEGDSFEAIFMGPTFVYRGDPVDFINHPLLGLVGESDQHNDVIETEISSLTLNGGQMTIRAGDGSGNLLDDGPNPPSTRTLYSPGAIHELSDDPSSAESVFHIFLEIDTPAGTFHNKDAFIVQSVIQELPPFSIEYRHELSEPISLYDESDNKVACLENATHTPTDSFCSFYAVHDDQLNNSQFFLLNQDTFNAVPMGPMHLGQDIEGLDIHPKTGVLYASSGDNTSRPGHLYQGVLLTHIGNIMSEEGYDYKEVDGLSFNPETEELWGWAQNEGLLKIDIATAKATLIEAYPGEVEDLTWNVSGTTLYAVENLHDDHDVDSHGPVDFEKGVRLLSYGGSQVQEICPELMKQFQEIEALETLSDDLLLVGYHGSNTLESGVIDLVNCNIVVGKKIFTPYNDVEGIAWPASQCD